MSETFPKIKLEHEIVVDSDTTITENMINDVYEFCRTAQMLRTGNNCSRFYENKYTTKACDVAINILFNSRLMGAYYFEANADPQKYMQRYILSKLPHINSKSKILEIGPGNLPLFSENEYENWRGIDYNYSDEDHLIHFHDKRWGGGVRSCI